MANNLLIVESPAKAKTIEKILGKDYVVMSCFGHIRDLEKKEFGIDINNNYTPTYIISEDKKKVVADLKKAAKGSEVWLATDEDREGEAISWHLCEVLKLDSDKTKRIVFNEITEKAIKSAVANPRKLNLDLVNAQQARRILDRLVGFELSPLLWKKLNRRTLSAGRVQSVAVRLIVDREREITEFDSKGYYKIVAQFLIEGEKKPLQAELNKKFDSETDAKEFLKNCVNANFSIDDIQVKPLKKNPAPPFTTSTLQQEASRKLGFSVSRTMSVAQRLYENGKITYMRTDSVNLSDQARIDAANYIKQTFGNEYAFERKYKTKSAGAQEAHEAIRPTYMNEDSVGGTREEQRLYELIWKRTVASQMSSADIEKTSIIIDISTRSERFSASGEVLKFPGFLKVYIESTDDDDDIDDSNEESLLPPVKIGQQLKYKEIKATQRFTRPPARFTEASLVKELEEKQIGRPSTYAPTISTILKREYVVKEDREGKERIFHQHVLENGNITSASLTEIVGTEKSKLFPTDIGILVNDFLMEHFPQIMNYDFTANIEEKFDKIAEGNEEWVKTIDNFYKPFHTNVEDTSENAERVTGERELGTDPTTGKRVIARLGKYGPMIQIGETDKDNDNAAKPIYAKLLPGQSIETITLKDAMTLFELPKTVGYFEDKEIKANIGRFGPYVQHDKLFVSLKNIDPKKITEEEAIELIIAKREQEKNKFIQVFEKEGIEVLNGRFGPYIKQGKNNFKIPKSSDPKLLTLEDCLEIINNSKQPAVKKKKK
jgi:DNA topoisomerase-1